MEEIKQYVSECVTRMQNAEKRKERERDGGWIKGKEQRRCDKLPFVVGVA